MMGNDVPHPGMGDDLPRPGEEEAGESPPRRPWAAIDDVEGRDVSFDKSAARSVQAETAELKMSAVALLKTESASLSMSAAGFTYARDDVNLNWSSANVLAAGSEIHMQYAGAQLVAAGGRIRMSNSLAAALVTRSAHVDRGFIGLLVTGKAELAEGTRVLLRPGGAAAMGAGFAGGLLLSAAFLWRLFARGMKQRTGGPLRRWRAE
jgi:hypothetical protein